ncbi:hypothetical protein BU26DRAFT_428173 [Trematosphaeria pertusa]|uniref:Dihydrofolate reductase n=1 Tax=Trematosphaeria pertusa TaxID=390896 RepID=A0A6A6IF32_9PLEO|nr:uncharacterized protein BU26DRAFT_428173 [Trematosphaeria pertusa]KAF2248150.1 hypothetical protein BU26DRAFT_428173 [Trematosphaeria pertusa]
MPPPSKSLPFSLTLILAATPSLGIGKGGTLPWPQLKKEMGYFARVTKRVPPRTDTAEGVRRCNAVIMGRKTWDSIPEKFRPLKGRLNVVLTRDSRTISPIKNLDDDAVEGPLISPDLTTLLHHLDNYPNPTPTKTQTQIERVFVIGGASIYKAALELPQTDRVLLTKIQKDYECDTFFPVDLDKEGSGWRRCEKGELEEWTGESVDEGGVVEGSVKFEFCLYEKET